MFIIEVRVINYKSYASDLNEELYLEIHYQNAVDCLLKSKGDYFFQSLNIFASWQWNITCIYCTKIFSTIFCTRVSFRAESDYDFNQVNCVSKYSLLFFCPTFRMLKVFRVKYLKAYSVNFLMKNVSESRRTLVVVYNLIINNLVFNLCLENMHIKIGN